MKNFNSQSWGTTLLRVMVGGVFLMHGRQKLFVFGFHGVAGMFGHIGIPFPAFFAVVVTLLEFVGGAALVLGLFTRWIAPLLAFDMLVAVLAVKLKGGFLGPGGYEFELLLLVASLSLALTGPGRASLDARLGEKSNPH
ncbi:MAG: DoxX family protein [Candidatus Sulfotelmatobacter sp.]